MAIVAESFLGVNCETGFVSLYEEFVNKRTKAYVIKGGPGTGKSTLMRQIAKRACEKGYDVELLHCSSDADSLDAVHIKQTDTCILDGTPPHVIEPPLPGAVGQLIDLYQFWDTERLQKKTNDIKASNRRISALYSRMYLYLGAAGRLQRDLTAIGASLLNRAKLRGYTERLCARYIRPLAGKPSEEKRFFCAFGPDAPVFYPPAFGLEKELVIEDEYGIMSRMLDVVRLRAVTCNHPIICGYSPLNPDALTHLILPKAGLSLSLSNSLHPITPKPYCRIGSSRFLEAETEHKNKIQFLKRSRNEILKEACSLLGECHREHDVLESYYKDAVDFQALSVYTDALCEKII